MRCTRYGWWMALRKGFTFTLSPPSLRLMCPFVRQMHFKDISNITSTIERNIFLFRWQLWLDASDRVLLDTGWWKRRSQSRLSDMSTHFLYSFTHEPVSKSLICQRVLQASGRFSQPQTVGKLLPAPLPPKTSCAFVLEVCTVESEINCTFIAQPDERLGKCSGVINRTLSRQIAGAWMASCAVSLSCCW